MPDQMELDHSARVTTEPDQAALPLVRDGVQTIVWHLTYGDILIEVSDTAIRVNGEVVEPFRSNLPTETQPRRTPTR
jgi:hypothetical protein